ncbi:MAG: hypothetical protein ACKN9F_02365 [Methylomonas sp.]
MTVSGIKKRQFCSKQIVDQQISPACQLLRQSAPNLMIKADQHNFKQKVGTVPDDFNFGLGFIF